MMSKTFVLRRLVQWLRHCARGLGIAGLLGGAASGALAASTPQVPVERAVLEARVAAVRQALQSAATDGGTAAASLDGAEVAQWFNWPNWPNWGNWGNWNNWPNWGNWFNR